MSRNSGNEDDGCVSKEEEDYIDNNNRCVAESCCNFARHVPSCVLDTILRGTIGDEATARIKPYCAAVGGGETCGTRPASADHRSCDDDEPTLVTDRHEAVLLFVDVSGFTKLSRTVDVESLSTYMNNYFALILRKIFAYGGDVLKFAGDAIFAEWRVDGEVMAMERATLLAARCGSALVAVASNYEVGSAGFVAATLDVHCGLGCGTVVGIQAGIESTSPMAGAGAGAGDGASSSGTSTGGGGGGGGGGGSSRGGNSFHSFGSGATRIAGNLTGSSHQQHQGHHHHRSDARRGSPRGSDEGGGIGSYGMGTVGEEASPAASVAVSSSDVTSSSTSTSDLSVRASLCNRMEFLIVGDPIDQVARAECHARHGELVASPEVTRILVGVGALPSDPFGVQAGRDKPVVIAARSRSLLVLRINARDVGSIVPEEEVEKAILRREEGLYKRLRKLPPADLAKVYDFLSRFVHPVVREMEDAALKSQMHRRRRRRSSGGYGMASEEAEVWAETEHPRVQRERRVSQSELRDVYTIFISPLISPTLEEGGGDEGEDEDEALFQLLNDIVVVTQRELEHYGGHLRQFIVDDKGVVLIGSFGLPGATYPHMISERALPATLAIQSALDLQLNVDARIGATMGKVYCGVVGGTHRHEFSILGPSVNLAARLMGSVDVDDANRGGILVDEAVRRYATRRFEFRSRPPVKAKGYDKPVPIFEPMSLVERQWKRPEVFVGRKEEVRSLFLLARSCMAETDGRRRFGVAGTSTPGGKQGLDRVSWKKKKKRAVASDGERTKIALVSGESGIGKSSMVYKAIQTICRLEMYGQIATDTRKSGKWISTGRRGTGLTTGEKLIVAAKGVCEEEEQNVPFSVFRRIITQIVEGDERAPALAVDNETTSVASGSNSSSPAALSMDRFRALCLGHGRSADFANVVGITMLNLENDGVSTKHLDELPTPSDDDVIQFIIEIIRECSERHKLVLLAIDDVQWMDAVSWKITRGLYDLGRKLMIICVSRPVDHYQLKMEAKFWNRLQLEKERGESSASQGLPPRYHEFHLSALTKHDIPALIGMAYGARPEDITPAVCDDVFEQCGGMPFFAVELVGELKSRGIIERLDGGRVGFRRDEDRTGLSSFSSLSGLLLGRLDTLGPNARNVLQVCAVMGFEFHLSELILVYQDLLGGVGTTEEKITLFKKAILQSLANAVRIGVLFEALTGGSETQEDTFFEDKTLISMAVFHNVEYERSYRFAHSMWRKSILDSILDERKRAINASIADAMEMGHLIGRQKRKQRKSDATDSALGNVSKEPVTLVLDGAEGDVSTLTSSENHKRRQQVSNHQQRGEPSMAALSADIAKRRQTKMVPRQECDVSTLTPQTKSLHGSRAGRPGAYSVKHSSFEFVPIKEEPLPTKQSGTSWSAVPATEGEHHHMIISGQSDVESQDKNMHSLSRRHRGDERCCCGRVPWKGRDRCIVTLLLLSIVTLGMTVLIFEVISPGVVSISGKVKDVFHPPEEEGDDPLNDAENVNGERPTDSASDQKGSPAGIAPGNNPTNDAIENPVTGTSAQTDAASIDDSTELSPQAKDVLAKVVSISGSNATMVGTPHNQAMSWILNDDNLQLDASDAYLIDRYVLALLYFALGGDDWRHKDWSSFERWLSPDHSVCTFPGVYCDENAKVQILTLESANLRGTLPSEIAKLDSLMWLDFSKNHITKGIPVEMGQLDNLETIHLFENDMSGSVPRELCKLRDKKLETFTADCDKIKCSCCTTCGTPTWGN